MQKLQKLQKVENETTPFNGYRALLEMPARYEQAQRIAALYLGPDCWAERGDALANGLTVGIIVDPIAPNAA